MWIRQVFVACLCILSINAVVNNGSNSKTSLESTSSVSTNASDSVSSGSEKEASRREAPVGLTDGIYAAPIDSYLPNVPSNLGLPIPVYGVPNIGSNLIYPAPPPDIPPTYGVSLKTNYGPPKISYGPPKTYGPPKHSIKYRPPFPQRPPKPFKTFYGPPRFPKPLYGPPKLQYGPPKLAYGPPKQIHLPSKPIFRPPPLLNAYGPPTISVDIISDAGKQVNYGPPEPIPHGPPHPGAPAPPTPPDIKYDGWQPIPGLVSRPPSNLYGQLNGDFVPPPIETDGVQSLGLQESYRTSAEVSDSYGAPLNTVTGSGGIISTSGEAQNQHQGALNVGLSAVGLGGQDNSLSVVKSVGYELFGGDTYSSPPANSFSHNGPYAVAHSYNTKGLSHGVGLIPPSGLYGVAPSSHYGTPLFQPNNNLNALEINPPKHPIAFREPVPHGLIQSIGNAVAQKDAFGIIESSQGDSTYIPPPVPDISKPEPSTLYSLPTISNPISFQNVVHGSSTAGLFNDYSSNFNEYSSNVEGGAFALPLKGFNTFNADLSHGYGLDQSHGNVFGAFNTYNVGQTRGHDFNSYAVQNLGTFQHDCGGLHKSQPLPQLSYGVPSASTYTEALSSLKTNIGGSFQGQLPHLTYGVPDLQTAHSQSSSVSVGGNAIISEKENYGKSLGESFAAGGELIKSQSLDLNDIPVQGALGSYTLQIQAADGLGSAVGTSEVPHDQVLNDGLLQSILAAIEQPQKQNRLSLLQPSESQVYSQIANAPNVKTESTSNVTVLPEVTGEQNASKPEIIRRPNADADASVDNNEIALYFNNNSGTQNGSQEDNVQSDKVLGSYVSFKTPDASYAYGDLKPSQNQQTSDVKV